MTNKKKAIGIMLPLVLAAVLGIFLLAVKPTLAVYTDKEIATNTVTMGRVDIEVREEVEGLTKKNIGVTIPETCTAGCYVRMRVLYPNITGVEMNIVGPNEVWKLGNDGYYYYETSVKSGDTVPNLYESIGYNFPDSKLPDGVTKDQLQIIVYAEAVQSEGFNSAEQAFGAIQGVQP